MTTQQHEVTTEELLAYADGSLTGDRRHQIAVHVTNCRHCQERLALSEDIGRLLRATAPVVDDLAGQAALKQRVRQQAAPVPRGRHVYRPLLVGLVLLLVLASSIAVQSTTDADFRLGRFVDLIERDQPDVAPDEAGPPGVALDRLDPSTVTEAELVFGPVDPAMLPLGLQLVGMSFPSRDRAELLYESADGVTILVHQQAAEESNTGVRPAQSDRLVVQRTEVFVERDITGVVSRMVWEYHQVVFSIIVAETGGRQLTTDDAAAIAAALIEAAPASE